MFVLYTNISHKEGIQAVQQILKKSNPSISIKVISNFLKIILTLNNFVFNSINYLHKKDCTMGTKCALSYANIFMGWFKEKFLFPLLANLKEFYLRFIDDIFLIWNGTELMNECHPTIKIECEMSKTEINFLHTLVFKVDN